MGKMMAVLLIILVLAVATLAAALPFFKSAALHDELVAARDLVAQQEQLRLASSERPTQDGRYSLLEGESSGILAAELQHRVAELAQQNRMSLRSTQVLAPKGDGDLTVIGLEANLQGEIAGLRTLLYAVETGAPTLFVEALSVKAATSPEAAMRPVMLDVTLKVRGYGSAREAK